MTVTIHTGDCRDVLRTLPDASVHCCVTSPPYFGLRDYGVSGQIGLETTPQQFVDELVSVFREVRRVLRDDGTMWLNLGDSYAGSGRGGYAGGASTLNGTTEGQDNSRIARGSQLAAGLQARQVGAGALGRAWVPPPADLKQKDLIGIPWMVAFALRADGWYLRQDIIWAKPNPMPESITDRCTKAHEYLFLLSKSARYYYDADAIAEGLQTDPKENYPARAKITGRGEQGAADARGDDRDKSGGFPPRNRGTTPRHAAHPNTCDQRGLDAVPRLPRAVGNKSHKYVDLYEASESEEHRTKAGLMKIADTAYLTRNKRSVWTVATSPFSEAHFATFPPALIEPCILAGCSIGGTVLDPFGGAGTTGLVADRLQRNAILIELNPEYAAMQRRRINNDAGMFSTVTG
jgi:DNA modification methylase